MGFSTTHPVCHPELDPKGPLWGRSVRDSVTSVFCTFAPLRSSHLRQGYGGQVGAVGHRIFGFACANGHKLISNSPMGMTPLRSASQSYGGQEEKVHGILVVLFVYIFGDDRFRHRDF